MVFVDSWAWVALALKNDQHHNAAKAAHSAFVKSRETYVTTDYVLSETITLLYRSAPAPEAAGVIDAILRACEEGRYKLVTVSAEIFQFAYSMRKKYADKPKISFTDFTSMVVMQERNIHRVFTGDQHFRQVGLGFELIPS